MTIKKMTPNEPRNHLPITKQAQVNILEMYATRVLVQI